MNSDYRNVTVCVETITPDLAARYLETNVNNRGLRKGTTSTLEREMRSGHFLLSDSCICFDSNGNLINGQHRLASSVNANVAFTAFVARNMPSRCQAVMDQGLRRSLSDVLRLLGVELPTQRIGQLMNALNNRGRSGGARGLTSQEAELFLQEHYDALLFVYDNCRGVLGKKGVGRAPALAAIARAWYHVDRERLTEFCRVYSGTPSMEPGNEGAHLLRDYLLRMSGTNNAHDTEIHAKAERAIQAFCSRQPISNLRAAKDDIYLLPSEMSNSASSVRRTTQVSRRENRVNRVFQSNGHCATH